MPTLRLEQPTRTRVARGAANTLAFFAPYAALIAATLLLNRGRFARSRGGEVDLLLLLEFYLLGAAVLGAVVGLCLPAMRRPAVALAVGVVGTVPFATGTGLAMDGGWAAWDRGHTITTLVVSLVLGAAVGASVHRAYWPRAKRPKRTRRSRPAA